jgi:hypothetical protein
MTLHSSRYVLSLHVITPNLAVITLNFSDMNHSIMISIILFITVLNKFMSTLQELRATYLVTAQPRIELLSVLLYACASPEALFHHQEPSLL